MNVSDLERWRAELDAAVASLGGVDGLTPEEREYHDSLVAQYEDHSLVLKDQELTRLSEGATRSTEQLDDLTGRTNADLLASMAGQEITVTEGAPEVQATPTPAQLRQEVINEQAYIGPPPEGIGPRLPTATADFLGEAAMANAFGDPDPEASLWTSWPRHLGQAAISEGLQQASTPPDETVMGRHGGVAGLTSPRHLLGMVGEFFGESNEATAARSLHGGFDQAVASGLEGAALLATNEQTTRLEAIKQRAGELLGEFPAGAARIPTEEEWGLFGSLSENPTTQSWQKFMADLSQENPDYWLEAQRNGFVERSDLEELSTMRVPSMIEAAQRAQMGSVGFEGLPEGEEPLIQEGDWRHVLLQLAEDIQQGSADVNAVRGTGGFAQGSVPSALGSSFALLPPAMAAATIAPPLGAAVGAGMGIPMEVGAMAQEAVYGGATDEQVRESLPFGIVAGALEGVPIGHGFAVAQRGARQLLSKQGLKQIQKKGWGWALSQMAIAAGPESLEEAAQEGLQAQIHDYFARENYDPSRPMSLHVAEMLAGALVGGGMAASQTMPAALIATVQATLNRAAQEGNQQVVEMLETVTEDGRTVREVMDEAAVEAPSESGRAVQLLSEAKLTDLQQEITVTEGEPEVQVIPEETQPAPTGPATLEAQAEPTETTEPQAELIPTVIPPTEPTTSPLDQAPIPEPEGAVPEEPRPGTVGGMLLSGARQAAVDAEATAEAERLVGPHANALGIELTPLQTVQAKVRAEFYEGDTEEIARLRESDDPVDRVVVSMIDVIDLESAVRDEPRGDELVPPPSREPPSFTPELKRRLVNLIGKWTGGKASVEFEEYLEAEGAAARLHEPGASDERTMPASGMQWGRVIELAMNVSESVAEFTAGHETGHFILRQLANDRQYSLVREAGIAAAEAEGKGRNWEEVAVDALGLHLTQGMDAAQALATMSGRARISNAQASALRMVFRRVGRFLRKFGNMLRREGYQTVEDIFEAVGTGEVGQQEFLEEPRVGMPLAQLTGGGQGITIPAEELAEKGKAGGFTYLPVTDESPTEGFAVSIYEERGEVIPKSELTGARLQAFADKNIDAFQKDPRAALGGWFDTDSQTFFLDVSVVEPDLETALKLARENNQLAIGDLAKYARGEDGEIRVQDQVPVPTGDAARGDGEEAAAVGGERQPEGEAAQAGEAKAQLKGSAEKILARGTVPIRKGQFKEKLVGTGKRGRVVVDDIGRFFTRRMFPAMHGPATFRQGVPRYMGTDARRSEAPLGRTPRGAGELGEQLRVMGAGDQSLLDDPEFYRRTVNDAAAEIRYQLTQEETGEGWYDEDIEEVFRRVGSVLPKLKDDHHQVMLTAVAAILSPRTPAARNMFVALETYARWVSGETVTGTRPEATVDVLEEHRALTWDDPVVKERYKPSDARHWGKIRKSDQRKFGLTVHGAQAVGKAFQVLDYLVETHGFKEAAEWLLKEHTIRELREVRRASGAYSGADVNIPGDADSVDLGAQVLSEKVGPFMKNLNGIKDTTADVWFARAFYRHFGLLEVAGLDYSSPSEISARPHGVRHRAIMKEWNREVARRVGISEQAAQAVLWYYEQFLYTNLGVPSLPRKFSDGAKRWVEEGAPGTEGPRDERGRLVPESRRDAARAPAQEGRAPGEEAAERIETGPLYRRLRSGRVLRKAPANEIESDLRTLRREIKRFGDRARRGTLPPEGHALLEKQRAWKDRLAHEMKERDRIANLATPAQALDAQVGAAEKRLHARASLVSGGIPRRLDQTGRDRIIRDLGLWLLRGAKAGWTKVSARSRAVETFGRWIKKYFTAAWSWAQEVKSGPKTRAQLRSGNSEVDESIEAAGGGKTRERLRDRLRNVHRWVKAETQHHPALPTEDDSHPARLRGVAREFSLMADVLREWENARETSRLRAAHFLLDTVGGLTQGQVEDMTRILLARDLRRDIDRGLYEDEETGEKFPLPFWNQEEEPTEHDIEMAWAQFELDSNSWEAELEASAEMSPVREALETRENHRQELVQTLVNWGLLGERVLEADDYYHRQVLKYLNFSKNTLTVAEQVLEAEKMAVGTSRGVRRAEAGFQKRRRGSSEVYSTNYLEAEFEWLSDAFLQIATKAALSEIKSQHDIQPSLVAEAKNANMRTYIHNLGEAAFGKLSDTDKAKYPTPEDVTRKMLLLGEAEANSIAGPYRQRRMASQLKLAELAADGLLSDPPGVAGVVDAMAEAYWEWQQAVETAKQEGEPRPSFYVDEEMVPQWLWWKFLKGLAESEHAGSIAARAFLKTLADESKGRNEVIGKDKISWKDLVPDGHEVWNPDETQHGYTWFRVWTIEERILDKMLDGFVDFSKDEFHERWVKGAPKEEWVVPVEVAATLQKPAPKHGGVAQEPGGFLAKSFFHVNKLWKQWALLSALRFAKYRLNNQIGDFDIAFAYFHFNILRHFKGAFGLLQRQVRGKSTEEDKAKIEKLVRLGVMNSGFTGEELHDLGDSRLFAFLEYGRRPQEGDPRVRFGSPVEGGLTHIRPFKKGKEIRFLPKVVWDWTITLNESLENFTRIMAYEEFQRRLERGDEGVYGASNPQEVDEVLRDRGIEEAAAKMGRELIGDYGNLSVAGQWMRKYTHPFWSWMEINAPRYVRLLRNAALHEKRGAGTTARFVGAKTVTFLAMKAHVIYAFVALWNLFRAEDEDDRRILRATRRQPHLLLWKSKKTGKWVSLRTPGALADAYSWFHAEDFPADVMDVVHAQEGTRLKEVGAKAMEAAKGPIEKLGMASVPVWRNMVETSLGANLDWEHPFGKGTDIKWETRPIRSRTQHALRLWSLDKVYDRVVAPIVHAAGGKPPRPKRPLGLVMYQMDPGEAAYHYTRGQIFDFLDKEGKGSPPRGFNDKSNALYNYKLAVRWGESEAARHWWVEYEKLGGTTKTAQDSVNRGNPLEAVPDTLEDVFFAGLTEEEKFLFQQAVEWYESIYGPVQKGGSSRSRRRKRSSRRRR